MKRIYQIWIIVILLIQGCVEPVLINVTPAENRLVISSQFVPDSLLVVTVSKSFSALSGKNVQALEEDFIQTLLVDRGRVVVRTEGNEYELELFVPGVYFGFIGNTEPFQLVELEVYDSATELSAFSSTQVMPQVRFDSVRYYDEIIDEDTTKRIYYEFSDPEEDNWYLVEAFEFNPLGLIEQYGVEFEDDTITTEESDFDLFSSNRSSIFSDVISDLTIKDRDVSRNRFVPNRAADTVLIVLINIEDEYYDFLQTRKRSGGFFASVTGEPINHPTNVDQGYGYFTMHIPSIELLIREQEE